MRSSKTPSFFSCVAAALSIGLGACAGDSGSSNGRKGTSGAQPGTAAAPQPAGPHGSQRLSGHVSSAMVSAALVARLSPSTPMHLAVTLPVRNSDAAQKQVRAVSDPASPTYRHYITPEQYADTYGPAEADYQAVADWARSKGLEVERAFSNRLVLDVAGTTDVVEKALHVQMQRRRRPDGTSFVMPDREPSIDLAVPISYIDGLQDFVVPRPGAACNDLFTIQEQTGTRGSLCRAGSSPQDTYMANDIRTAYLGASCNGLTGAGQSVGLLVLGGGYSAQDGIAYAQAAGLSPPNIRFPLANQPPGGNQKLSDEVALDVEMVMAMAPGASIALFEDSDELNLLAAAATSMPLSYQLSNSWGPGVASAILQPLFDELALQGQSYFVISGDWGSTTTYLGGDVSANGVTVVGGTYLGVNIGANGSAYYQGEAGWINNSLIQTDGGGFLGPTGSVPGVPIPYYQQGLGSNAGASAQYRNIPDVSMLAADTLTYVALNPTSAAYPVTQGGTSEAAPLWAGIMALVNQQNPNNPVGFANPLLYSLAKTTPTYFHDVTSDNYTQGYTPQFSSAPGYDLVTGLGTPTCGLITALASVPGHTSAALLQSGFKTFGGDPTISDCVAPAGDKAVTGARLVSETCQGANFAAQNWVLTYAHGAISPATDLTLCVDGSPSTGAVVLNPCNGSLTQTWTVQNNIMSAAVGSANYCLDVSGGATNSGQPLDLIQCNEAEQQDFWPWGFPLQFASSGPPYESLNNAGNGKSINETNGQPNLGAPPWSSVFFLTYDNTMVTSGGFVGDSGAASCVKQSLNGYSGTLSSAACAANSNGGQNWYFAQGGVHNGSPAWATIRNVQTAYGSPECIDAQGGGVTAGFPVGVAECSGSAAQTWELVLSQSSKIGFPGYPTCPTGSAYCGSTCVNVQGNDPNNCGGCGITCNGGCSNGVCQGLQLLAPTSGWPAGIALDSTTAYFTVTGGTYGGKVMKVPLNGGSVTTVASGLDNPDDIKVDSTSIYWVNQGGGGISGSLMKVALSGGTPTTLVSGYGFATLAVDSQSVYYPIGGSLMKVGVNGGTPTVLASGGCGAAVAIDSNSVYYFGNGAGGVCSVMKVPLNGGATTTLFSGLQNPVAIAVSWSNVYWSDVGTNKLMTVGVYGGTPTTLFSGPMWNRIAADGSNVYFWSYDNLNYVDRVIQVPVGGGSAVVLANVGVRQIALDSTYVYWTGNDGFMGVYKNAK